MDLETFLAARYDENEAVAKAATPGPWTSYLEGRDHWGGDSFIATGGEDLYPYVMVNTTHNPRYAADRDHIALHDPARALRKVEAGRKRLALMAEATAEMNRLIADDNANRSDQAMAVGRARAATVAVKYDAEVWSDHPDYREEWKP